MSVSPYISPTTKLVILMKDVLIRHE